MSADRRPQQAHPLLRHARTVGALIIAALAILANTAAVVQMAQTALAWLTRLHLP